ncbi:hypothetical protein N7456_010113 [Penicillium angulare]|uniref:Peptidase A1 domain-containing protein n=1 Tax=Penicillium angulare TaxID=116970 RepID=A0A9W9F675_9EURO|nr:hypothetical protein N7456_010113 [Penicillium angulare]
MRSQSTFLLSLASAALPSAFVQAEGTPAVLTVPLVRTRDTSHQLSKRSNTVDVQSWIDASSYPFIANYTWGTPPQHLEITLETLYNASWVQGVNNDCLGSNASYCEELYNQTASTTAMTLDEPFDFNFSDTYIRGDFVTDVLSIGGIKLNMTMGVNNETVTSQTSLGLAYGNSLTQALADAGEINSPAFSIYDQTILFGGVNKAKYDGPLTTFPITNVSRSTFTTRALRINMSDISVSGSSVASSEFPLDAVFDIQQSWSYLPYSVSQELNKKIGDVSDTWVSGFSNYSCDSLKNDSTVDFKFGGTEFKLNLTDFIDYVPEYDTCIFTIGQGNDTEYEGSVVLGTNFLNLTYAVFDLENDEISLAKRSSGDASDDIVEIKSGKDGVPGASKDDSDSDSDSAAGRVGKSMGLTTLLVASAMFFVAL